MDNHETVLELLKLYTRKPERERSDKGSVSKLLKKYGDRLSVTASDLGDDAVEAMEGFLQDQYWASKLFPLNAYLKNPGKFLSHGPGVQERTPQEPVAVVIRQESNQEPPQKLLIGQRKLEAIRLLSIAGSPASAPAMAYLAVDSTSLDPVKVEQFHAKGVSEFKKKFGWEPKVLTQKLVD